MVPQGAVARGAGSLLAAVIVIGCAADPSGTRHVAELPTYRLIDHLDVTAEPGLEHGGDVERERERRRAVVSPMTFGTSAHLEQRGPFRGYRVQALPADVRTWGVVDVVPRQHDRKTAAPMRADLARDAAPFLLALPSGPMQPVAMVTVQRAVPIERFDVDTRPFTVPAGAVLAFGVSQMGEPRVDASVRGHVHVLDGGTVHELWSADVSAADTAWRNVRVSLAPWTGRTIRLRFSTRAPAAAAGMLAAFGEPTVLAPARPPVAPVNVVLVSMDTLRAQSVGAYGCARPTTPTLDALAAEGALFENAFTTAAYTLPAHASMFWGLDLRTHRVLTPPSVMPAERRSVGEALHAAGWATAAFTSAAVWLTPAIGFRRGFDAFVEQAPPYAYPTEAPYPTFTRGIEWAAAQGARPFFAFLHNFQVHRPYLPPGEYTALFGGPSTTTTLEDQRLAYEQEVRFADDQLRGLLDAIDWLGLRDRTLVIVTSDHGEAFGEHGWVEHTYDVHDEIARVPLVMRLPGAIAAGRRIAEPASVIDVLPTILDLLGVAPVDGIDGVSLLPLLTGATDRLTRDAVYTEAESERGVGWTDLAAAHTRTHTCIHRARTAQTDCWDRRVDPWQRAAPVAHDDVADGRAALDRLLARPPATGSFEQATDAGRVEQLRALGYVE